MSEQAAAPVAIVVPTRNSARTLGACLDSIRAQTVPCQLVVVDNHSTDATQEIAQRYADAVLIGGPERSRQRNVGARYVNNARILGFVDSDMVLSETVAEEAMASIESGDGAVVVPERSVGTTFWARTRAYERSFYIDRGSIEAARFFEAGLFTALCGFDESLLGGEDWDLTIRARQRTPIGRTVAHIEHDEGGLAYIEACRKKAYYAEGLAGFAKKHGRRGMVSILDRPYLRQPWRLLAPHPMLGAGLMALKAGESVAVLGALARARIRAPGRALR